MNIKYKIEQLRKEIIHMLQEQELINTIHRTSGVSKKPNERYEILNQKISSNIKLIQELDKQKNHINNNMI